MISKLIFAALLLLPTQAPAGKLLIAGGNVTDKKIYSRFVELSKSDKVAIVTTASAERNFHLEDWKRAGLKNFVVLGAEHELPADVKSVWFIGGDQGRLENSYVGKKFEQDLLTIYRGGGIIGGSSAGAAILSRIMIRGGDADKQPEIGFGFDLLPDSIIDQHFTQRGRLPRLKLACELYPGLVGIGIDENTAVVYDGKEMEVIGQNQVSIVHHNKVVKVRSGEKFFYPFERLDRKVADNNPRQPARNQEK